MHLLADGVDPSTGEVYPAASPFQDPQIIRALAWAIRTLDGSSRPLKNPKPQPEKAGKPWDEAEDRDLLQAFDSGSPIKELVLQHQRTRGAIQARLVRLGRLAAKPFYDKPTSSA